MSLVLPFRTNEYVVEELIDWDRVPDDPMYQLTFSQRGMLDPTDYAHVRELLRAKAPNEQIRAAADAIRRSLNPHPAGQMTDNVARLDGRPLPGMQHKYDETVLFFPSQGQTCHAYCTFCFRWAQFVGMADLKMASRETAELVRYLQRHPEVSDVLITGGDPMIMRANVLAGYIEPLLESKLESLHTIRIGTKSVGYWPQRFVTDPDADEVLRLFERVVASGRQLALMAHYNHPVELSTPIAREALRRIRATGAVVRMQSPLVRHINDDAQAWADLWRTGANLGAIPYYMFVERDTGARSYFEVPLVEAWEIFRDAYRQVSGLARTVRGPSMSAHPGKVRVVGVSTVNGRRVFVLEYLQARDPEMVGRPFFAKFDSHATWFDQLEPAFPSDRALFHPAEAAEVEPLRVFG
ncbi:MAG: lysine 2,3-aminomutase [Bryobacterales bacterium]|nr:lysine 2,3-aminomutase [Bryobacterales bacterium]